VDFTYYGGGSEVLAAKRYSKEGEGKLHRIGLNFFKYFTGIILLQSKGFALATS